MELPDRDEDTGRWSAKIEDPAELLELMEPGEPYKTAELADAVGMTVDGMRNHLNDLLDAGEIDRREVTPSAYLWTRPKGESGHQAPRASTQDGAGGQEGQDDGN